MRRELFSVVVVTFGLLIAGCSTTAVMRPEQSGQQELLYNRGTPTLVSRAPESLVVVQAAPETYEKSDRLKFAIAVSYRGQQPIDVSEASVKAKVDGRSAPVVTAEQLRKEESSRATWEAVAIALNGASAQLNATNSAYSTQTGTYSGNTYSSGGRSAYSSGSYSGTTYNPAQAQAASLAAQQATNAQIGTASARAQENMASINENTFQRTTLLAGGRTSGIVTVESPAKRGTTSHIELSVSVGADTHRFNFRESEQD